MCLVSKQQNTENLVLAFKMKLGEPMCTFDLTYFSCIPSELVLAILLEIKESDKKMILQECSRLYLHAVLSEC